MKKSFKITKQFLEESIIGADQIVCRKDGTYLFRQGFYYTHGKTANNYAASIKKQLEELLKDLPFKVMVVDSGEIWKPFRGDASVAASSHWFVQVSITNLDRLEEQMVENEIRKNK